MDIDTIKTISEAAKNVTDIAKEPLHNLMNKPTKSIGDGLSDIFELIFAPVKVANIYTQHKIFKFKQELEEGINKIPDDKRIDPPLNIVGPVLEASRFYIDSDDIRSMFANLISASMNVDTSSYVHPAFSEIIKQLRPLDAQLFSAIKESNIHIVANVIRYIKDNGKINRRDYNLIIRNFIPLPIVNLQNCTFVESSIDNLIRLNLINTDYSRYPAEENVHKLIENHALYKHLKESSSNDSEISYKTGGLIVTSFGLDFAKVCI